MKTKVITSTLAFGLALISAATLQAATLTHATGGDAISANTTDSSYTSLTGPVYQEGSVGDVGTGTIILDAPSGFIFDTSGTAPTVLLNGSSNSARNINNLANGSTIAVTVTTTSLTITITYISKPGSGSAPNKLTWQNVRVRPVAGNPLASGNITKSGSSAMTGVTDGVTNFGTLTEVAGAASKLVFTTSAQTICTGLTSGNMTVQRQDQFNNPNTSDATITVNLTTTSGGGNFRDTGDTTTITSVSIVNGSSAASFKYKDTIAGNPTITAAKSGGGLTNATQGETINAAPRVTANPSSQTACAGTSVTFTAEASGSPTPTVQWQASTDGGITFSDIAGATSTSLTFTTAAGDNGKQYRARFTNSCGSNAATTAATLTVNPLPAATVSGSATICAGQSATILATLTGIGPWTVTWSDGATQNNVATSPATHSVSPSSTTTYTVTAVSDFKCSGGTSSGSATITVNAIPAAPNVSNNGPICAGPTLNLTASTVLGATYSWTGPNGFNSSAQNPSIANATTAASGTYTVTVTVDGCASIAATTAAKVNSAPTLTCPADIVVPTALGDCTSNVTFEVNSIGDPAPIVQCMIGSTLITSPHAFAVGTNTVNCTGSNSCGTASCSFTVVVEDSEPPTISNCPEALTVSCASEVPAADVSSVTATDNCSAVTVSFVSDTITNQTCANRYTLLRTYQATDAAGNSATCIQTITVDDQTAPVITSSPADTTVSCAAAAPAADDSAVTATDNCGGLLTVTHDADLISAQSCANRYTISRTYHATDACGNSSSVTQIITVDDQTAPVLSGVPADGTASCDAVPSAATVTATDNCDGNPVVSFSETRTDGQCPNHYTLTRTWTATDACGNSASQSQTLTVRDTTGPVLSGQGADATIESPATPVFTAPTATDNCDASPLISFSDLTNRLCGTTYSVKRTWTATDSCGNVSASVSQTITIGDATPPLISCPADVTTNSAAGACFASGVVLGSPTTSDNGGGHVTVINDAPSSFPIGINFVGWTVTDDCGNSSTCTQQVIVVDTEPPTISSCPAGLTVSCASEVPAPDLSSVTATGNCSAVTVSFVSDEITNQSCDNRYTITRTYQVTDASGNRATCTQTITVDDETAPVIASSPANIVTNSLGPVVVTYSAPSVTDNCTATPGVVCAPASGSSFDVGTNLVTCTATDNCGNSTSCTFKVIVAPSACSLSITCPDNIVTNIFGCSAVVTYPPSIAIDDNCGITMNYCSPASGSSFSVGTHTVTCTAKDTSDNTATCTFTIIVTTLTLPTISCPTVVVPTLPPGARLNSYGIPARNDSGEVAFQATLRTGYGGAAAANNSVIYAGPPEAEALIVRSNDTAPGTGGTAFKDFSDPALNDAGEVAFRGILKTTANAIGLWSNAGGTMHLVARQGDVAPDTGGATFASFTSFALPDTGDVVFLGVLTAGSGTPAVSAANNTGIWTYDTTHTLHKLIRTGDSVLVNGTTMTLKTLTFLPSVAYSLGQSRSVNNGGGALVYKTAFTDGSTAILGGDYGTVPNLDFLVAANKGVVPTLPAGAKFSGFGIPARNDSGEVSFRATLRIGSGGVTAANDFAIYAGPLEAEALIVRSNDPAPNTGGATFRVFSDPALNNAGEVAFRGTLKTTANSIGLWSNAGGTMHLVARQGDVAPDTGSATFASFTSFALPDTGDVVFLGVLTAGSGSPAVSDANNTGIWVYDATHTLHKLIRTGDSVLVNGTTKTLKTLTFLPYVSYSPGQSRSVNNGGGALVYKAAFTDDSTAILSSDYP